MMRAPYTFESWLYQYQDDVVAFLAVVIVLAIFVIAPVAPFVATMLLLGLLGFMVWLMAPKRDAKSSTTTEAQP
jgi:flagellar biosynthesis component FlhA